MTKPPMLWPTIDRRAVDAARLGDRHDLVGPLLERVVVAVVAVAVAGQVDGHDAELVGERGGDVGPPVRVGAAAVDEHQAGLPGSPQVRNATVPPSTSIRWCSAGTARAARNQSGASGRTCSSVGAAVSAIAPEPSGIGWRRRSDRRPHWPATPPDQGLKGCGGLVPATLQTSAGGAGRGSGGDRPEAALGEVVEGLAQLVLGVHHEGALPGDRLTDRLAAEQQHLEVAGARVLAGIGARW